MLLLKRHEIFPPVTDLHCISELVPNIGGIWYLTISLFDSVSILPWYKEELYVNKLSQIQADVFLLVIPISHSIQLNPTLHVRSELPLI